MPNTRLRGQESELILIVDGQPQLNITFIQNHNITYKFEKKSEGYIGETTQRFDTVFMGIDGKFSCHTGDPDIFTFIDKLKNKARSRTPNVRVNIKTTFNYPTGRRARGLMQDVEFGDVPIDTGSRGDKVKIDFDYSCSDAKALVS